MQNRTASYITLQHYELQNTIQYHATSHYMAYLVCLEMMLHESLLKDAQVEMSSSISTSPNSEHN